LTEEDMLTIKRDVGEVAIVSERGSSELMVVAEKVVVRVAARIGQYH